MGKSINTLVLDAALNFIADNCNKLTVCTTEPTNYTEANATYNIAEVAMSGGDFTKAAGDTSGRKVTVGAKSGLTATDNGTAEHIALVDTANSRLLLVTDFSSQAVSTGNTLNVGSFKYEINNPS